jgi:hypothetical protein
MKKTDGGAVCGAVPRSMRSQFRKVSRYNIKHDLIFAHIKAGLSLRRFFKKFANTQQHCAQIPCTKFQPIGRQMCKVQVGRYPYILT